MGGTARAKPQLAANAPARASACARVNRIPPVPTARWRVARRCIADSPGPCETGLPAAAPHVIYVDRKESRPDPHPRPAMLDELVNEKVVIDFRSEYVCIGTLKG